LKDLIYKFFNKRDCVGSINSFRDFLSGVLLMNRSILSEFMSNMQSLEELKECQEILETSNITYKVHDKWGRPNTFILFD
jgi:hypothetical protein